MASARPYRKIINYLEQPVSIAPLVVFRIVFGLLMLFSTVRYVAMGWVESQLIAPVIHFSYYGFEWVKPLPGDWMYLPFVIMGLSAIAIAVGAFYKLATVLFFVCFSYVEMIDITYYLNHYYFVSIVAFLMILVPANRCFSMDARWKPQLVSKTVSLWCIGIFKLQIAIVYIYAGLAKLNYDWLIRAMPLSIWLPAKTSIPVIGWIFKFQFTAYLFSWIGMLFDTLIVFGLMVKRTRGLSYVAVVIFHTITGVLFQIGIFPLVMILSVTIFFSSTFHEKLLDRLSLLLIGKRLFSVEKKAIVDRKSNQLNPVYSIFLGVFFMFQLVFPWRYLLYDGNVFWTEQGYRFSWRVMLMEKAGTATFYVKDGAGGREGSVINHQFLNPHQEKQMAMQPDLILQYAHHLEDHFTSKGMKDPYVRAEVYVTLNAHQSSLFIDPQLDLTKLEDHWSHRSWILPFEPTSRR